MLAWTGSTASVLPIPSVHLSTKTGGRKPCSAFMDPSHTMTLFTLSTIVTRIWSEDRSAKFLYAQRSPMSHRLSVPSCSPFGVASSAS